MALAAVTFVTLVVTVILTFFDRKKATEDRERAKADRAQAVEDRKRAEEDRDARIEDARRAQADKVAAWWIKRDAGLVSSGAPVQPHFQQTYEWGATIRNASDLPIRDVRTTFYQVDRPHPVGPWNPVLRGRTTSEVLVVPPGDDCIVEIPVSVARTIDRMDEGSVAVGIEFTDADNVQWERDPRGVLNPLT